ncbi:MAG: SGNH/GDSL hydrolase family protein [Fuerstiella sp.]
MPSVLVAFVLCEVLVRYFNLAPGVHAIQVNAPRSAYKLSKNPILIYELKENYHDDNPDYFDRLPHTNSHGQRDHERSWLKPNGVRRIIVLGDSVTVGDGIADLDDTIPRQLEQSLQTDTEVLNLGIAGYCTYSEAELLKVKGLKYRPDLVIVIFVENDYQHLAIGVQADDVDSRGRVDMPWSSRRPAAIEKLFASSDAFRYLSLRANLYGFRDQWEPHPLHRITGFEGFGVREGLKKMVDLSDKYGFNTMIAIWPSFETAIEDRHVCVDDSDRLVVERIAEEFRVPTFRLSDYFQKDYLTRTSGLKREYPSPRSVYTFDGMHPNETGAMIAADALTSILNSHPELLDVSVQKRPAE